MSRTVLYACILLLGVFISAVSQVILKKAAIQKHGSFLKEYLNPLVIIAYVIVRRRMQKQAGAESRFEG